MRKAEGVAISRSNKVFPFRRCGTGRRFRHDFTLVELLVVIAIIGILAALLMPSLQSALAGARSSSCMNNLRQCGMSFGMYASDYNNFYSVWRFTGADFTWPQYLYGTHGGARYAQAGTLGCPANANYAADVRTRFGVIADAGYGIDTLIYNRKVLFPVNSAYYWNLLRLPAVTTPGRTVLLGDSVSLWAWDQYYGHGLPGVRPDAYGKGSTALHALHGGRVNILLLDNHAVAESPFRLGDLKKPYTQRFRYYIDVNLVPYTFP